MSTEALNTDKLRELVKLSTVEVEALTRESLNALVRDLGKNAVRGYTHMKRARLAQAVLTLRSEYAQSLQTAAIADLATKPEEQVTASEWVQEDGGLGRNIANALFNEVVKAGGIADAQAAADRITDTDQRLSAYRAVGQRLNALALRAHRDWSSESENRSAASGAGFLRAYRNAIIDLLNTYTASEGERRTVHALLKDLDAGMRGNFIALVREKNTNDRARIDKTRVEIESKASAQRTVYQPVLDWAFKTLSNLESEPSWLDVSLSIAAATGRRMVEVHSTARFELETPNSVRFHGQTKTQKRSRDVIAAFESGDAHIEQPSYIIPTLVPAQLIIDGLAYLDQCNRRIKPTFSIGADGQPYAPFSEVKKANTAVNNRFAKEFTRRIAALRKQFAWFPDIKYSDLRPLAAAAVHALRLEVNPYADVAVSIAEFLGHESYEDGTRNLNSAPAYMDYSVTDVHPIIEGEGEDIARVLSGIFGDR